MALASSVTGAGKQVSKSSEARVYRVVSAAGVLYEYTEKKTTTVTEWPAITKAAGDTWLGGTPAYETGESRTVNEENRVLGSYTAVRSIETITTTKEEITV